MRNILKDLIGIIGYARDVFKFFTINIKDVGSFYKFATIDKYRKKTNSSVFIETGTYHGLTSRRASWVFSKVYTIELDKNLADKARRKFKNYKNTRVIEGDASEKLECLLAKNNLSDILVFLDAHFSGRGTAKGEVEEPAIQEIKILSKYKDKVNCFIIDDFRLLGSKYGHPKDTPYKYEVLREIEENFDYENYETYVKSDQIIVYKK